MKRFLVIIDHKRDGFPLEFATAQGPDLQSVTQALDGLVLFEQYAYWNVIDLDNLISLAQAMKHEDFVDLNIDGFGKIFNAVNDELKNVYGESE